MPRAAAGPGRCRRLARRPAVVGPSRACLAGSRAPQEGNRRHARRTPGRAAGALHAHYYRSAAAARAKAGRRALVWCAEPRLPRRGDAPPARWSTDHAQAASS
eukprot:scaffold1882_cov384-Prasinococcus_capsulatus_cf.AAC.12